MANKKSTPEGSANTPKKNSRKIAEIRHLIKKGSQGSENTKSK